MPGRLPESVSPDHFSAAEQTALSQLIHRVKDNLLSFKGFIATPVHYAPRFSQRTATLPEEQYGLLQHRHSPTSDRRSVLISKQKGQLLVDFHVDYEVLTEAEKPDPQAFKKRQASHQTGLKTYALPEGLQGLLSTDLYAYLLDGYLPTNVLRT